MGQKSLKQNRPALISRHPLGAALRARILQKNLPVLGNGPSAAAASTARSSNRAGLFRSSSWETRHAGWRVRIVLTFYHAAYSCVANSNASTGAAAVAALAIIRCSPVILLLFGTGGTRDYDVQSAARCSLCPR